MRNLSPHPLAGAAFSLAGFSLFAWGDAIVKHLSAEYSLFAIMFYDLCFTIGLLLLLSPRLGGFLSILKSPQRRLHILRGIVGFAMTLAGMYAFSELTLAKTYALLFSSPFFTVLLALLFFKEKVSKDQWLALALGFCGVLIVLRPGLIPVDLPSLAALASAVMFSISNLIARQLKLEGDTLAGIGIYTCVTTLVCVAPFFIAAPVLPPLDDFAWLALLGVFAGAGFLCISLAFMYAPAAVAAPLHYSQMLWAIVFGYFIFGDSLNIWVGVGSLLIIASGVWLIRRKKEPSEIISPVV